MSLRRKVTPTTRKSGSVKLCRICDSPAVIRGLYCSEDHAEEYKVRSNQKYARLKTFERDGGICADCGRNCQLLSFVRERGNSSWQSYKLVKGTKQRWRSDDEARSIKSRYVTVWVSMIKRHEIPEHLWMSGPLWESDHVLPVWRGGGNSGLDNRQTLCFLCHNKKCSLESKGRKLLGKNKMYEIFRKG